MRLAPDVRDVLERSTVSGVRLDLPPGQLDRKLYLKVAAALELMGGAWNKKEKAHFFHDRAEDVVADAIATGAVIDFRKEFQFFETPPDLARHLCRLAALAPGLSVLEPSAGRGRIVAAIRELGIEPLACEIWDDNRTVLTGLSVELIGRDFLGYGGRLFDRIVANPPFARQQDIAHVTHAWSLLRPDGVLVSVMSPGWTFRRDARSTAFRELARGAGAEWLELEDGAFKASGTAVAAGIIVIRKDGVSC